jgi:glycosyltransferase involved in cell wall biosynthesis
MNVIHVFNTHTVSGPEMLVLPALARWRAHLHLWNLAETRRPKTERGFQEFCRELNLPLKQFTVTRRFDWHAIASLNTALKQLPHSSIIHTHDVKASLYVWLARWISGRHDLVAVATHHGAMIRPTIATRLYEIIFVYAARRVADALLCVSENDFRLLSERGVPVSVLRLHRNGVERPALEFCKRRAKMKSIPQHLKLTIIARLSCEKNHSRAFGVLALFSKMFKRHWTLDVIGDGVERHALEQQVQSHGLEQQVRFLGFIQDAWKQLDNYHCLLSFSLGEGLPVTLLESGWRRTPVFASAVGGVCEIIGREGGETFSLGESDVHIAQRLFEFISQPERMTATAEHLHQRVTTLFSETLWLEQLERHYRSFQNTETAS